MISSSAQRIFHNTSDRYTSYDAPQTKKYVKEGNSQVVTMRHRGMLLDFFFGKHTVVWYGASVHSHESLLLLSLTLRMSLAPAERVLLLSALSHIRLEMQQGSMQRFQLHQKLVLYTEERVMGINTPPWYGRKPGIIFAHVSHASP